MRWENGVFLMAQFSETPGMTSQVTSFDAFFFWHRPVWGCPKIEDTVSLESTALGVSELRIKGDNENHGLAIYLIPKLRTGGVGGFPQIDLCTVLVYFLWWTLFHKACCFMVFLSCVHPLST